jgi:hypothetical protein
MGNVVKGLILVAAFWIGIELFMNGPSRAFDGLLAGYFHSGATVTDRRTTPQRAGDAVRRSQAEAEARLERMLPE